MGEFDAVEIARIRAEAAAAERAGILAIIERYSRYLAHGHGVNGPQALQQITEEILRRGEADAVGSE